MKINTKKLNIILSVIFTFCATIFATIGVSLAWFIDSKNSNGSATFGKIELVADESVGFQTIVGKTLPGQVLVDGDITCAASETSESMYVRAKITITTSSVDPSIISWVNSTVSPAINNQEIIYDAGVGYQWVLSDGYYYLFDKASTPVLLVVTNPVGDNNVYTFIAEELKIPLTLEPMENNQQYNVPLTVSVVFQAIQNENLSSTTLESVKTQFDAFD